MNDIVKEARELIDGIGVGECGPVGPFVDSISNLLERIQELEQERDAALETLRLERLSQSVNKADVIKAETQREYADEMRSRMAEGMEKARRERDAALERVRVLNEAARDVIYRGSECGMGAKMGAITDFNIAFMGLESVVALKWVRKLEEAPNA